MTSFTIGTPPLTWVITSKVRPDLETPPWSSTGFKTFFFDCEISIPEMNRKMSHVYMAPPDYVVKKKTELDEDDHRFILGSFFADIVYGAMSWKDFLAESGYDGTEHNRIIYETAALISKAALLAFRFPTIYFNEIMEELVEGEFQFTGEIDLSVKTSDFHEIKKEE